MTKKNKNKKTVKIILLAVLVLFVTSIVGGFTIYRIYAAKMKSMLLEERLQYTLEQMTDNKKIYGTVFSVYRGDDKFEWNGASGNMNTNSQYSIASVTKMYTAAVIMLLIEDGRIELDKSISEYLSPEVMNGLHIYQGKDYSHDITIRYLLSHKSGLPDYFTEFTSEISSIEEARRSNLDLNYNINDILYRTKMLSPHFKPRSEGKAYYSDGNYQLLGEIIEKVTDKPLCDVYKEFIFNPLELKHTYLQTDNHKWGISSIYNGETEIQVPGILTSERSAGGIVSTANDNMVFLKAFFAGKLFHKDYLEQMKLWNKIFFPMEYGMGIMRCSIPIGSNYELIGHSGSTGTVSYYCPARDIYITGTTQQLDAVKATEVLYRLLFCFDFE